MALIGLLPASGRASRIAGIPKFCLPISDTATLLHRHVEQLLAVCDEVRVCTRAMWAPIVEMFDLPIKLYVRAPSTMSDAVIYLSGNTNDTFVVGMPDTIVLSDTNHYRTMVEATRGLPTDVMLGTFGCPPELRGHVGQVLVRKDTTVAHSRDKVHGCEFPLLWGAMLLKGEMVRLLDATSAHPGLQLQEWIDTGYFIRAAHCAGEYVDIGRFAGLSKLYRQLEHQ